MKSFSAVARVCLALALVACGLAQTAEAGRLEIAGPPGSVSFGGRIAVLPNGNLVITDPGHPDGGAVYLYSPSGQQISKLTGYPPGTGGWNVTSEWDLIEIIVLANGNYLVRCPQWSRNGATSYLAWGSATSGVSGYVNSSNALLGVYKAYPLANGNYVATGVIQLPGENSPRSGLVWANGKTGLSGHFSQTSPMAGADNSSMDAEGYFSALPNGHFVVQDGRYIRWLDGTKPVTARSDESNSLYGATVNDERYRQVVVLGNGNYVVASPDWDGIVPDVGAVTWVDGSKPFAGAISAANSLVGSRTGNHVGWPQPGAIALKNGNYVALSSEWEGAGPLNVGAVTWGDGTKGVVGEVSPYNSMVGSTENDFVGGNPYLGSVTALENGNYVVYATLWDDSGKQNVGAVRWGDGTRPSTGPISHANSLYGTETEARVGRGNIKGVEALANGHYVVNNIQWPLGMGSVTWGDGESGSVGPVTAANSITGETDGDYVTATPLADGNYLAVSYLGRMGGVLWANGFQSTANVVLKFNSVTGSQFWDFVDAVPLSDGSYIAGGSGWSNGTVQFVGGWRWLRGGGPATGPLTAENSIIGSTTSDNVGNTIRVLPRGHYLLSSTNWTNGDYYRAGAVTLAKHASFVGPVDTTNSVAGEPPPPGRAYPENSPLFYDYDSARERLVVGRPLNNRVTVFTLSDDLIFTDGFESVPRTCEWRLGYCREPQLKLAEP